MAALGRLIMNTAKLAITALNGADNSDSAPAFESPSPNEVLEVKNLLEHSFALPLEIIDAIIDHAEYWPRTTVSTYGEFHASGGYGAIKEDRCILRALPLGYFPGSTDNGSLTIPLEPYVTRENAAHIIEPSEAVQSMTSVLLNQWKIQSKPRSERPCRKVVFTIKSSDQGWANDRALHGTYESSYTWFDVGLESIQSIDKEKCSAQIQIPTGFMEQVNLESKVGASEGTTSIHCDLHTIRPRVEEDGGSFIFSRSLLPTGDRIQSNRTATREAKEYVIAWAHDDCIDPLSARGDELEEEGRGRHTGNGNFVRSLQIGDIVTVWARARFPGWQNQVKAAKIDVYWAV